MVTKLPNHWCASSWDIILAIRCLLNTDDAFGSNNRAVSLKVSIFYNYQMCTVIHVANTKLEMFARFEPDSSPKIFLIVLIYELNWREKVLRSRNKYRARHSWEGRVSARSSIKRITSTVYLTKSQGEWIDVWRASYLTIINSQCAIEFYGQYQAFESSGSNRGVNCYTV